MPTAITNDIKISVETFYRNSQPGVQHGEHLFAYRITIENCGDYTIKLLRRHWRIVDSLNGIEEVEGEGVIGQQPVLEPGQQHQYVSGCGLRSEMGKMFGSYLLERQLDGKRFRVRIPEFMLVVPMRLN